MKYTVVTKFISSGEFIVEAESQNEAEMMVKESCRMLGGVLSTYPILAEDIVCKFPDQFEQEIVSVCEPERIANLKKDIRFEELNQLNSLIDRLGEAHTAISEEEQKRTVGMNTPEANKHYATYVNAYHEALMNCVQQLAELQYTLKQELK